MYGCRGRAKSRSALPVSTNMPAYMTFTRSHMPGDDAEVVRDQDQRHVALGDERLQQLEDLRLDRHVERRRRLVGDQQLRLAGERHRDHRPLPHPARELVRVVLQPLLRARDADLVEQLDGALGRPARGPSRSAPRAARGSAARSSAPGSATSSGPGRSSRSPGRGSCAAARRAASAGRGRRTSRVPRVTRPARGRMPSSASEVTLLPQPDSPTIPSVSPGAMSNEIPLTACTVPRPVQNWTCRSSTARRGSLTHGHAASGRGPRAVRRRSG